MVKYCIAFGCKNVYTKGNLIQFHRFPHSRQQILKQWIQAIRRKNWEPTKHSVICSEHFTEDCYKLRPGGAKLKYLKEDAVPTLFNFPEHLQKHIKKRRDLVRYTPKLVEPSSSGRSAQLLGNAAPTFVGFSAAKDGGFVPVLPGFTLTNFDDLDPNINPNFQMVLKKMNKKDSTTKLKALQEFAELIRNSEQEAVKAVLPFWPRLYCHLVVDVEHRVRESAHQAHRAVVLRAKRNIAPYLRQLAGPWFTSQYDTYPPAASAATQAFQDAFPPNKLIEAIVFCQEEIINYIHDNLIVQTAQTLSNPKTATEDEMEAKYQRVLVSSLQGYSLYLAKLPQDQLKMVYDINKKLVSSKKFWKYSKHTIPMVRNAWFSTLIALCQKAPELLADETAHACVSVFNNLDEADPTVLPTVWDAALHVLTTVQDCWFHVSAEKLVLPKLWNILRQGGQGNAATIFPNLMPLLSKIPVPVRGDTASFYTKFFSNMRQGLSQKCVYQSHSESNAAAKGYLECLRYIISGLQGDDKLCRELLHQELMACLELVLQEYKYSILSVALFHHTSLLVQAWSLGQGNSALLELFWDSITNLNKQLLLSYIGEQESLEYRPLPPHWLLERQVSLCLSLRNPKLGRKRENLRVKFNSPAQEEHISDSTSTASSAECSQETSAALQCLVHTISESYLCETRRCHSSHFLGHLSKLAKNFASKELFEHLATCDGSSTLEGFFEITLLSWLKEEETCTQDVMELSFILLQYLNPDNKGHILDALCEVSSPNPALLWCITTALNYRSDPSVCDWLHSAHLGTILVQQAQQVCTDVSSIHAKDILKCCLEKTPEGELVISSDTLRTIMTELYKALDTPWTTDTHKSCATFVAEIVLMLYHGDLTLSPWLRCNPPAEGLVLLLFQGSCLHNGVYDEMRTDITHAWQAAVVALAHTHGPLGEPFLELLGRFSSVLAGELLGSLDVAGVDHIAKMTASLLRVGATDSMGATDTTTLARIYDVMMSNLFQNVPSWTYLTDLCLYADNLRGHHYITRTYARRAVENKSDTSATSNPVDSLYKYYTVALFSITVLMELSRENLDNSADDDESETDDEIKEDCNHLVSSQSWPLLQSHLLNILYANVIAHTFTAHFKSTLHYNNLAHKFELLNLRFCLFQEKSGFERDQLIIATQEKAKQEGDLWVKAALSLTDANFTWLSVEVGETDDSNNTSTHADQLCKTNEAMSDTDPELPTLTSERLAVINNCQCQAGAKEESLIINQLDNVGEARSIVRVKRCCMCMIKANRTNLLFESHIGKLDWSDVQRLSEAARVMAEVVNSNPEVLEQEVFDVVHITLTSWLASLEKSKESLLVPAGPLSVPLVTSTLNNRGASVENSVDAYKVAVLGANILQLFATLERFYATAEERKQSFYEEWKDVFVEEVYKSLLSIFIYVSDHCDIQQLTCHDLLLLEPLCEAVSLINPEYFLVHNKQAHERLKLVMKYCCHLVCSPIAPLQLVAYHVIKRLSRGLTSLDTVMVAAEADLANLHLWMLNGALELTQGFVDTLYSDQRLGDCCTVQPHTDAYTFTLAYLLLWDIVLDMCGWAGAQLRYHYAAGLSNKGLMQTLLQTVFCLMPEEILRLLDVKVSKISEVLMSGLNLKYGVSSRSETLQDLACWMYFCSLRRLPAMVRQWWSGEEPRVASLVEKVTTRYMSPLLCSLEMQSVQKENTRTGNMAVKVHPTAREVVAVYHVDEVSLELSIQLPLNHPLGPVVVESSKQMVDTSQWRNWLMQLNVFLTYQNGSLWDGLALWKSNLDKRFEGIEECYICFSVIHGSNFQIPKLCCSTCKKKFHSPCLYKWFSTSNKATCPICRNLF